MSCHRINLYLDEYGKVNRLIKSHCCNYCNGSCLLLDDGDTHDCVQINSFSSIMCNYFARCVLPNDAQPESEIMQPQNCKSCVCRGAAYVPASNRQKYCPNYSEVQERRKDAERNYNAGVRQGVEIEYIPNNVSAKKE